jgi:hypothetical protein
VGLNRNGDLGGSPPSFRIGDRFRSALLDFRCGVCVGANFNDFAAFGFTFKILFEIKKKVIVVTFGVGSDSGTFEDRGTDFGPAELSRNCSRFFFSVKYFLRLPFTACIFGVFGKSLRYSDVSLNSS